MGKNHIYCPADLNFPKKALQAMQGRWPVCHVIYLVLFVGLCHFGMNSPGYITPRKTNSYTYYFST